MVSRSLFSDSFYDLYDGRYIASHGIPHRNVWTVASHGAAWIDQQWLAHLIFYGAWSVGGYPGLALLSASLVTAGFAMLALLMLRRGVPPTRMFAWTMVAFAVCLGNTVVRAQSFGYLFLGLLLWLLVTDNEMRRLRARTFLVVPVLALWANTHGTVLLGAGLVVLYAGYRIARALASRDVRSIPLTVVLAVVAVGSVACTPYGPGVATYYRELLSDSVLSRYIMEWAPPSIAFPLSWAFFALLAMTIVSAGVAWRRSVRPDTVLAGLAVVLLGLALTGVRYQAWFGLGGSLFAADTLARAHPGVSALSARFSRATAAMLAMAAAVSLVALAVTPANVFESGIPVRALNVAASIAARNPTLRVIGDDWSDTPMLWLHPAMAGRVGFDIREEQYSRAQLIAYFDFVLMIGPRWQRVTRGYDIIVASRQHYPALCAALVHLPGWRVALDDRAGVVLVRRSTR